MGLYFVPSGALMAKPSRKRGKRSELEMIQHAASEMKTLMPTIFTALGFNIY
jgi:hypothetical protein